MDVGVPDGLGLASAYGPFIDGEVRPVNGRTFDALNASTAARMAQIARCGGAEIDAAVRAARPAS